MPLFYFPTKLSLVLTFLLFIVVADLPVRGQSPLGVYEFTGDPNFGTQSPAVTRQPLHATFSAFRRHRLNYSAGINYYNTRSWPILYNDSLYLEFTIKAQPGYKLHLEQIYLEQRRSNAGPRLFRVAHNGTGTFATATPDHPATTTATPGLHGAPFTWNFTDFTTAAGDSVTFRIYAWNRTTGTGAFRVDNVTLYGTVIPDVRVNEFHYYNTAQTRNGFVELLVPPDYGQSGELLSHITLALYNAAGQVYYTATLVDFTSFEAGIYYLDIPAGLVFPGGISVSAAGKLTDFISYGGAITAVNGPAAGFTSQDIGITEAAADGAQNSLYLPQAPHNPTWAKYATNRNTKGYPNDRRPLPVDLLYFNATITDSAVVLHWATGWEESNDYFRVERSRDARHFSSLGRVSGQGTTTGISTYTFRDTSARGVVYYRLQQVDRSGAYTYSPVIAVTALVSSNRLTAYPNPATDYVRVTFGHPQAQAVIYLTDVQGRLVLTRRLTPESGQWLDVRQLRPGNYWLYVVQAGQKWAQPLLKK